MRTPIVSVLLPVAYETVELRACLASLAAQTLDPGAFEVLIADGSNRGLSRDLPDVPCRLVVIPNPDQVMSRGLNRVAASAQGRYLAIVSAHSTVPAGYLREAVAAIARSQAANVGGRVVKVGLTPWGQAIAAATSSPFAVGNAIQHYSERAGPADSVFPGFIERAAFDDVSGFNPDLGCNEDDEFNARLRARGHIVWYDPALRVVYHPRESLRALWRQQFRYGRWKVAVARLGVPGYLRARHFVPALSVIGAAVTVATLVVARPIGLIGLSACSLYGVIAALEGVRAGRTFKASPVRIAVVFPIVHAAYGLGFLRGLLDRGLPREPPTATVPGAP